MMAGRHKPTESAEHRVVQLARRVKLRAIFDAELKQAGGDYITIVDGAGQVQGQWAFASPALIWLAARLRAVRGGRG